MSAGMCEFCGDPSENDWPPLCGTGHCLRCTAACGICQAELHDNYDADGD